MDFKNRIRNLRIDSKMSGQDLANRIGPDISRHAVSTWENGKNYPKMTTCFALCEIFGCSLDYLLGKSDFRNFSEELEAYNKDDSTQKGFYVVPNSQNLTPDQRAQLTLFIEFLRFEENKKRG